ncbi:MAG: recombinase family protein [Oscillibacter sp.]|nr:recombinase family protein [Oscillibacter sp.]
MKLAASYVRVSTEEQAMHGHSIEAQRDAIRKYAKDNGYLIVKEYSDEGVSGKKPYNKRPALSQFMEDIQSGEKVDVLLFCKLDRFYRSVKLYYQAVEIMDRCGVAWKAILEDYETETANGRMVVNIMLSVAENEADRTSERIKFVFANKIAKGEAITGRVPFGYKIVDHRYQPDPEKANVVRALFQQYEKRNSTFDVVQYVHDTYGENIPVQTALWILRNRIYLGYFRGNPKFCEPLVTEEQFNRVQELMKSRSIRHNQSGQVYIFSGLLVCGNCGKKMAGNRCLSRGKTLYVYYKCNAAYFRAATCDRRRRVREDALEDWLLKNIGTELENQRLAAEAEVKANAQKVKHKEPDRAAILRKMNRLKDLYVNEVIDLTQYKADYEKYTAQLAEAEAVVVSQPKTPDFTEYQRRIECLEYFYKPLRPDERQMFWRGMIREIRVDPDDSYHIFFR